MNLRNTVDYLYRISRAEEWKDTKLNWLFIALGVVFLKTYPNYTEQIRLITLYTLLSAIFFSSVAIANDYADKEIDQKSGKNKLVYSWSQKKFVSIIAILSSVYFFLTYLLLQNATLLFLSSFIFVFGALGYSLKPFRFKEKGFVGIFVGGTLRIIPLLLLFLSQKNFGLLEISFLLFITILGFRQMFIHQIKDWGNDLKTNTNTFVTKTGKNLAIAIMQKLVLPIEVISLLFLICLYGISVSNTIYLLVIAYIIFWLFLYIFNKKTFSKINQLSTTNSFLADFYFLWWPIFTGLLILYKLGNPLVLLITVYLQRWHFMNLIKKIS